MTQEKAFNLVRNHEGKSYNYRQYSIENGWDIEDLVNYLGECEKSLSSDYTCVMNDIEHRIESCDFDSVTKCQIFEALLDDKDIDYLYGYIKLKD